MSGRDSKRYEGNGIVYRRNMKTQKDGVSPSRASSVSSPPSQHSRGSVRKTPRTAADSIRSRRALPGEQANAKRGDKKVEDWVSKDCELLFDEFGGQDCRGVHMYALHDSMGGNDSEDGRASSSTPGNGEEIASMEDGKLGGKAESLDYAKRFEKNFASACTPVSRESSGGLLGRVGSAMSWTIHTMSPSAQSVGMNDEDETMLSAVDSLEDLFCWKDTWRSCRALFGGLYLLFCLKIYISAGIRVIQPTTALAAAGFLILFFNTVIMRCFAPSVKTSKSASSHKLNSQEAVFLDKIASCLSAVGHRITTTLPPFIALIARHLSHGQGFASFYLGIVLWLFMLLGELRILSQISMLMLAYASLFLLPVAYLDHQKLLDRFAGSAWKAVLTVCAKKNRIELACSIAAGLALCWILDMRFMMRASAGMLCTCCVLFLRLMPSGAAAQPNKLGPNDHSATADSS